MHLGNGNMFYTNLLTPITGTGGSQGMPTTNTQQNELPTYYAVGMGCSYMYEYGFVIDLVREPAQQLNEVVVTLPLFTTGGVAALLPSGSNNVGAAV